MTGPDLGRRRILHTAVVSVVAALGGTLASVLVAFSIKLPGDRSNGRWVKAAALADLVPGEPHPAFLSVPQTSGWFRTRSRQVVYLTRTADNQVRAMSAVCTHLGCLVKWDVATGQFRCPCHGGIYDRSGNVAAGPPPRALQVISVRLERTPDETTVLVRV
jgi:Rieske Fe-S protein